MAKKRRCTCCCKGKKHTCGSKKIKTAKKTAKKHVKKTRSSSKKRK